MSIPSLSPLGVYTLVKLSNLDRYFYRGDPVTIEQDKPWVQAAAFLKEAQKSSATVPIFFSNADSVGALYYWAQLTDVKVRDKSTRFTIDKLRRFTHVPATSQLMVQSTGKPMSVKQIGSYIICHTPIAGSPLHQLMQESISLNGDNEKVRLGERYAGVLCDVADPESYCDIDRAIVTSERLQIEWLEDHGKTELHRWVRCCIEATSSDGIVYEGTFGNPRDQPSRRARLVRKRDDACPLLFRVQFWDEDTDDKQEWDARMWLGFGTPSQWSEY